MLKNEQEYKTAVNQLQELNEALDALYEANHKGPYDDVSEKLLAAQITSLQFLIHNLINKIEIYEDYNL